MANNHWHTLTYMIGELDTTSTAADNRTPPRIMLVIPCYNEEPGLRTTADELHKILQQLIDVCQIDEHSCMLFVDDGSQDGTWNVIRTLHDEDSELFHGLKLAHNKGHQNALFAGLMHALHSQADAAISMDADLQDDPDAVADMVEAWREGAEIVYGVRDNRETDTAFKRSTAHMFYALMKALGTETVPDHADYRLMSHTTLEALSQYHESNLFLRGIVPSLGFPPPRCITSVANAWLANRNTRCARWSRSRCKASRRFPQNRWASSPAPASSRWSSASPCSSTPLSPYAPATRWPAGGR